MPVEIPKQDYTGSVEALTLGSGENAISVGGETAFPFCKFEGEMPNSPKIGIQVLDYAPDDWAETCTEPYKDVLADPVAWAKKAQDEYGADFIQLWLKSTDPNGLNRSAAEAAETARAVADAISVPLLVWGNNNPEKDAEVLTKVAEVCEGKDIIIGPVTEDNHKQLGAQALAYNLTVVANSPIDINLAKQLNILLNNLGVPLEKIIIDPTTGGLGYGLEYSFSVMERIRQAALTQDDEKLQCPFLSNLADEVWKTKEAKLPSDDQMGEARTRGVLMEALTATTLLNAGADMLVMRHPEAIDKVREYIAQLGGFEMPKKAKKMAGQATAVSASTAVSLIETSLKEGALCQIVKIMDMPVELAAGHAIALIKCIEGEEPAGDGIILSAGGGLLQAGSADPVVAARKEAVKEEFKPLAKWEPVGDPSQQSDCKVVKAKASSGMAVDLIQECYEPGVAQGKYDWRSMAEDKEERMQELKTSLRYWFGEGYGSEKRKKPA